MPILEAHGQTFREKGVPGLLSREGFDMAWSQYQGLLIEKLNQLTLGGNTDEFLAARDIAAKYSRMSSHADLFNYASMAYNNHFFFERLSPEQTEPSRTFLADIKNSFGSIETLRAEMIETADAMFGPGFVWLMKDNTAGQLRILCTYNAGSPLSEAHFRAQTRDMATTDPQGPRAQTLADYQRLNTINNSVGAIGPHAGSSAANRDAPGHYTLSAGPILCVNTWQHVWMRDYRIDGKRAFIKAWWERIDWNMVEASAAFYGYENQRLNQNIATRIGRAIRNMRR